MRLFELATLIWEVVACQWANSLANYRSSLGVDKKFKREDQQLLLEHQNPLEHYRKHERKDGLHGVQVTKIGRIDNVRLAPCRLRTDAVILFDTTNPPPSTENKSAMKI